MFKESTASHTGQWMKLTDAAFALGVSEITIRRRIKTGRIPHEFQEGKYFVYVDDANASSQPPHGPEPSSMATAVTGSTMPSQARLKYENQIQLLKKQLSQKDNTIQDLQRTVADQQTLIAVLEEVGGPE